MKTEAETDLYRSRLSFNRSNERHSLQGNGRKEAVQQGAGVQGWMERVACYRTEKGTLG